MRALLRWLGRLALAALAVVALAAVFGPTEPVETDVTFDPRTIGGDVDAYLAARESAYDDIRPGAEKRVVWAGAPNEKTPRAVLYVHGFSAGAEEIRPVPDRVAEALGANLVFTRLTGHGRSGPAMAEASVAAWMADMAEALAVARAVGEEVIVISTSTGSTLATIAALDPALSEAVVGQVFVSPNFGVNSPAAPLLTWPLARHWVPLVVGAERGFTPHNAAHGRHWTTRYPTVALLPMAAAVKHARTLDHARIGQPLLVMFSPDDQVVLPDATRAVATRWGGPVTRVEVTVGEGDDPNSHVIAGDILSPGQTDVAVRRILDWASGI